MKTYTNTFNTYNATEIMEMAKNNTEIMDNLKEEAYRDYEEIFNMFYSKEIINTLEEFADLLETSLTDYSFSLGGYDTYAIFDLNAYNELSNEEKNHIIYKLNILYKQDYFSEAELTGEIYDCYIHYLLKEYWNEEKQSFDFNTMTALIRNLPTDYAKRVCKDDEKNAHDLEHFLSNADANNTEFNEDGTIHKW